jgi:pimeloyl-ACP methyl ester carboxylesterase
VFVDPRGAGYSLPNLYMRRDGNTIGGFTSANRAWFAENDIDVSLFNTTQIAKDYEAARVALGYPSINLFASSYGTFVAQELLRRHPSKLRAVVMSGNAPATDPFLPSTLGDEKAGMEALIRDVGQNALARRAFPRFRQRFYKLMDRLTNDPVTVTIPNRDTRRPERVVIDGREFVSTIVRMLQSTKNMRYIPALVAEMERTTTGPLLRRFFAPPFEAKIDNPFGMYLSVLGTDFAAPNYVKDTERGILSVGNRSLIRAEGPLLYQLANIVVSWGVPYNPGTTRTLPQSTVRTLFLNGMMDAQTPVSGGATIAQGGVTNSVNYIYPRIGHAVGFLNGPDMDAAVAFIRNPAQTPAYSRRGLTGRKFYITKGRTARVRTLDNWRDSVIDSPVTAPLLPGRD